MTAKRNWLRRCGKACLYTFACLAVFSAVSISLLRASLPYLNQYHDRVIDWLVADQSVSIEVESIDAGWYKFGPVLIVNTLDVKFEGSLPYNFDVARIKISIDFWNSLLEQKLLVDNLILDGVQIKLPVSPFQSSQEQDTKLSSPELTRLLDVFFRQLEHFELTNSNLRVLTPAGEEKIIHIPEFAWLNQGNRHRGEGWAYINDDITDNNLRIMVDVTSAKNDLASVSGQVYVQAENVSLSSWFERVLLDREGLKKGALSFESWIDIVDNKPTTALLQLQRSEFSWQSGDLQQDLNIWGGELEWQLTDTGWQLDSRELALVTNGIVWPPLALQVRQQEDDLFAFVNQVELSKLAPIVALSRHVDDALFQDLKTLYPHGLVRDVKVKIPLQDWTQLRYQLNVDDFKLQSWQGFPAIDNVDIAVTGSLDAGQISVDMQDTLLDLSAYLEHSIQVNQFSSDLTWRRYDYSETDTDTETSKNNHKTAGKKLTGIEITADKVFVDTPELVLDSQFLLDIPGDANPFLSLAGDLKLRDASKAYYYYPTDYMGESLIDYLRDALKQGHSDNGQLLWFGEFANYPYSQGDGIFETRLNVVDAEFKFDPQWPTLTELQLELLFQNDDLFMSSRQGNLAQVAISAVDLQLPNLGNVQALGIQAQFATTGKKAKSLIDSSPLPEVSEVLNSLQVSGNLNGEVDIILPFTDDDPVVVSGDIGLVNNSIYLPALDLTLMDVQGGFKFDDTGLLSTPLTAKLYDQPLNVRFISAQQDSIYHVNVDLAGVWASDKIMTQFMPGYEQYVSGDVNWQGTLNMAFPEQGFNYEFDVQSDLERLSIDLPMPLAKSTFLDWPTDVSLVGNDKQAQIQVNVSDVLYFSGQVNYADEQLALIQSLVQIGNADELLISDTANAVVVNVDNLDIADWVSWYNALPESDFNVSSAVEPLSSIKVAVANTVYYQQPLTDLNLSATKGYRNWGITLKADEFNGNVVIPELGNINIDFDYLYLPDLVFIGDDTPANNGKSSVQASSTGLIWQDIPGFNFNCGACIVGQINLGKASAEVSKDNTGLKLKALDVDMEHSAVAMTGRWFTNKSGQQATQFQGELKTKSVEEFMTDLGLISPLAKTPADVNFKLAWQDDPLNLDIASLNGSANIVTKAGRISNVSDKGTRFLSVLSLQSLVKRLSLDFSDVFNDGLPYSSMSASLQIVDGAINNKDFLVNSSSGKITGNGYIDLVTDTINYNLSFFPDVTSSLPVLAAFAVTPTTALAVFALSKILEPVVEVITELKFNVSGDFDNPTFTEVKRNQKSIAVPDKLIDEAESQTKRNK
ncbi:TIGR02099 family protein [Moritella marina ATCC 15381]|uniref:TIGR02099 family protein n=1 Tax=Moritella marina ATCC 15381 TaxID=1202962 RepID=A0A5J6WR92_MORMI|nr:YhdP family protein [Moritella marina]QFI39748.1 TIGR02099 family protein [Moritella marina ATCC 15381]